MTRATAPSVVAAATAGAAAPIPHASSVAPPFLKPSGAGKKSAEDAVPTEEETATAPTVVAVAAAGAAAPIPHASAAAPPLSKPSKINILRKLRYRTVEKYHTDHTDDTFNSLPTILVSWNNPSCVCRCQYNKIYFRELFLAAHFSQKFKKPSDMVPTVHFLLCDDIIHFATYLVK